MTITPRKPRGVETFSGYFLHNIQPHRVQLHPDYDPDRYPKGPSLHIREDEGDGKHVKSFFSFSDDKGEKEKKERRSEYKFRKRVAKKRKHDKKPILN